MPATQRPTVVIIGAGFAGLYAAKKLAKTAVDVLLVDRQNFHLFSPLIYQVATSGLDPSEVAYPVRAIFLGKPNVRFLMGEVQSIDRDRKTLAIKVNGQVRQQPYDYLVVAAGSQTHFFGQDQVERHAFGLKSLEDAVVLRNHILKLFEKAAWTTDAARREAMTTMVVVGGGPTGLETAGALQELVSHVLQKEYAQQWPDRVGRVILVEMQDHLLAAYPVRLQQAAYRQLEDMGIEVVLGNGVVEAGDEHVRLSDGRVIPAHTLVWAAGVKASPVAEMLAVDLHRSGRVPVACTLQLLDDPDVYVVGDMAYLEDKKGEPYPMLIPPAKQQGMLAAANILRRRKGQPQRDFHYGGLRDRGIMATIGRSRAVAWIFYRVQLTGFLAWIAWLGLHLVTLIGFRNRLNVFVNWVWNYLTYDRSVRIILEPDHSRAGDEGPNLTGTIAEDEAEESPDLVIEH
jgi:NADH:ubiquinone reductase (H+-translocating)